ncbi:DUF421 domain-containing protein [Blastococcus xanthinilyticus]|uniref:Uncharacterized protein DUF421 n=1 Tax=Blastococcus xanthinilyticus TaxID=1564164 RepID=A0A5S5CS69_9ACTN|nr:YetF domain-containing protein [Blastococcus xanthinilyticus]TYP86563.1 uncharacterized protein DUF421 [Blastococcus xanthinilyticus]
MMDQLGIDAGTAGLVVLTTVAMYLLLVVCVRLVGQRSLATMSSFDLGCAIALGSVIGRTSLLLDPTLATGALAVVTLFATQAVLGRLRQTRVLDRLMNRNPVLLMAGDTPLRENMRAAHVAEDELRQKLRQAGIRDLAEVRCVVLERTGAVSVIRQSEPLDPWLFADVPGAERLHAAVEEHDAARQAPS